MSPKKLLSCLSLLALLATPSLAAAQTYTLRPAVAVDQHWDDNTFAEENGERSSWWTRASARLALTRRTDRSTWRVWGALPSRKNWRFSELDTVDQRYGTVLETRLTQRLSTKLDLTEERFSDYDPVIEDGVVELSARPDLLRRRALGELRYQLTPRTETYASLSFFERDYDDPGTQSSLIDQRTTQGAVGLTHLLTSIDRLELSASASRTRAEPTSRATDFERENDLGQVSLSWSRAWSPKWTTNTSIGVRRLSEDVLRTVGSGLVSGSFRPVLIGDDSDSSGTGTVGSFQISRTFARGGLSLGYSRETRTDGTGSSSGSIDIDALTGNAVYRASAKLTLRLIASHRILESASSQDVFVAPLAPFFLGVFCPTGTVALQLQGVDTCRATARNDIDSDITIVRLSAEWKLSKNASAQASFDWIEQESRGRRLATFDRRRVTVGVRYFFDHQL